MVSQVIIILGLPVSKKKINPRMWEGDRRHAPENFLKKTLMWEGGRSHALGNFLKKTLKNTFCRHIYTELRNQAISQVIISRD